MDILDFFSRDEALTIVAILSGDNIFLLPPDKVSACLTVYVFVVFSFIFLAIYFSRHLMNPLGAEVIFYSKVDTGFDIVALDLY